MSEKLICGQSFLWLVSRSFLIDFVSSFFGRIIKVSCKHWFGKRISFGLPQKEQKLSSFEFRTFILNSIFCRRE
jgi:hypothetical protein